MVNTLKEKFWQKLITNYRFYHWILRVPTTTQLLVTNKQYYLFYSFIISQFCKSTKWHYTTLHPSLIEADIKCWDTAESWRIILAKIYSNGRIDTVDTKLLLNEKANITHSGHDCAKIHFLVDGMSSATVQRLIRKRIRTRNGKQSIANTYHKRCMHGVILYATLISPTKILYSLPLNFRLSIAILSIRL